ncbi:phosphoglycerate dehydrogenase [Dermatophilaceae bacterium Soc4.6]
MKALLLENIHADAVASFEAAGIEVVQHAGAMDAAELVSALAGVQLLGIRSGTRLTAAVLDAAPDLLAVGAFCIGTNQIDLDAAAAHGVAAFNAPFSNTRSVVELAIAEMIALTRRLTEKSDALHRGLWDKSAKGAHEMRGRTLGIIGYGNIGSQLSVVAEALGMGVVYFDADDKLPMGNARKVDTLDELLGLADVVTLHVDGRIGNAGLFGAKQFAAMKKGSVFLNLSRGFVVDTEALADSVRGGHLAGAAIDVFPVEPKAQGDTFESSLRGLPNVILTPHVGGSTEEAQRDIGRFVSGKLRDYVERGSTSLSVNLPAALLDAGSSSHRLALLHRNIPGVLASVNQLLSEHGVNIEGQVLATRGEMGYVITDVAADTSPDVATALEAMPETISLRVLR